MCKPHYFLLFLVLTASTLAQDSTTTKPWREFSARASHVDPRAKAYPEIDFLLEKDGKPTDFGHACSHPNQPKQNRLVIWMMGHSPELFHFLADQGFHVLRVHYANGWFNRFGKEPPPADPFALGRIRLEAATGQDHSPLVNIEHPDGMQERARQFLMYLSTQDPDSNWQQFLDQNSQIRWDQVIMAGASHGATTSARFALHQRVNRVVMFCGPRDQYESWQALDSATPRERFFGFSHTLDTGWTADHYCRSWELLGLQAFGPIINVDSTSPPFEIPEDSSPTQMLNKTKNVPIAALPQEKQLSETPTVPTPTNLYGNISLLTPQILSAPPLKPTLIASVTKDPLPEPKNPNLRTNTESFPILLTPLSSIPTINSSNEKNIPPYSRTPYLPPSSRRLR